MYKRQDEDGKVYMVHAYAGSRAGLKSVITICELNAEDVYKRQAIMGAVHSMMLQTVDFYHKLGFETAFETVNKEVIHFGTFASLVCLVSVKYDTGRSGCFRCLCIQNKRSLLLCKRHCFPSLTIKFSSPQRKILK